MVSSTFEMSTCSGANPGKTNPLFPGNKSYATIYYTIRAEIYYIVLAIITASKREKENSSRI